MADKMLGIVFSNMHDTSLGDLTSTAPWEASLWADGTAW